MAADCLRVDRACEKHVNSDVFGGDDIDYDALEEQIAFIPAYAFKKFIHKMIEEEQKVIRCLFDRCAWLSCFLFWTGYSNLRPE